MSSITGVSSWSGVVIGLKFSITLRVLTTHVFLSLDVVPTLQLIRSSADKGCIWES